jgi:protoporphyrinogen oxidase
MFLMNYSEKLWGLPCKELSHHSAGERLNGLNLRTLIIEAFCRRKTRARHLDGSFYYPKYGIGDITGKCAEACGHENIKTRSRITKIFRNHDKIQALEINGRKKINTGYVVNTLPINLFLNMLAPRPPEDILDIGNTLIYQNVILVALFLNRSSVTKSATIYFPDKNYFFTRLYEPKNRSIDMSPPGRTSLVVEIPCRRDSEFWDMKDTELIERTSEKLVHIGLIREDEIFDACVRYLDYAYPVFQIGFEEKIDRIFNYINKFKNLTCAGRSGKFEYKHLHNMMKSGKEIVENYRGMNSANRLV